MTSETIENLKWAVGLPAALMAILTIPLVIYKHYLQLKILRHEWNKRKETNIQKTKAKKTPSKPNIKNSTHASRPWWIEPTINLIIAIIGGIVVNIIYTFPGIASWINLAAKVGIVIIIVLGILLIIRWPSLTSFKNLWHLWFLGILPFFAVVSFTFIFYGSQELNSNPGIANIIITSVPTDPPGINVASQPIKGTVTGGNPTENKVVIYAYGGNKWFVEPDGASPLTQIGVDGSWKSETHGGLEFVALLVKASYHPDPEVDVLPAIGGDIIAKSERFKNPNLK